MTSTKSNGHAATEKKGPRSETAVQIAKAIAPQRMTRMAKLPSTARMALFARDIAQKLVRKNEEPTRPIISQPSSSTSLSKRILLITSPNLVKT